MTSADRALEAIRFLLVIMVGGYVLLKVLQTMMATL